VREAQDYTWHALEKAYRPGMGQHLPDRLFWARDERDAGDADEPADAPEAVTSDAIEPARRSDVRGTH
jgi:hydroxymethylpyrimidine/phosphomethylpyrimidine kinase